MATTTPVLMFRHTRLALDHQIQRAKRCLHWLDHRVDLQMNCPEGTEEGQQALQWAAWAQVMGEKLNARSVIPTIFGEETLLSFLFARVNGWSMVDGTPSLGNLQQSVPSVCLRHVNHFKLVPICALATHRAREGVVVVLGQDLLDAIVAENMTTREARKGD